MSALTGVAAQALADFADDFEDGVLTVPGGRVSDDQGGWRDTDSVDHPCKALVTNYDDYRRPASIPATDRLVLILSGSLPADVFPAAGHKVTAPDPAKGLAMTTFDVIAKGGDAAGALYKLQAR